MVGKSFPVYLSSLPQGYMHNWSTVMWSWHKKCLNNLWTLINYYYCFVHLFILTLPTDPRGTFLIICDLIILHFMYFSKFSSLCKSLCSQLFWIIAFSCILISVLLCFNTNASAEIFWDPSQSTQFCLHCKTNPYLMLIFWHLFQSNLIK